MEPRTIYIQVLPLQYTPVYIYRKKSKTICIKYLFVDDKLSKRKKDT